MLLRTNVLPITLSSIILWSPLLSGFPFANITKQEDKPRNNRTVPTRTVTAETSFNITNWSIKSTAPWTTPTNVKTENVTSTAKFGIEGSRKVRMTKNQRNNPKGSRVTLMSALIASATLLSVAGVVAAVYFLRWKKIKRLKEGFQEEMATICLHDELASEALYSSWKPFMDTQTDSNKMTLVIEASNRDSQSSQTNS